MRNKFVTLFSTAAIITMSAIGPAHALVVSDPGSYARAAQRLSELKKQLETAKENLDQITSVKERLEGNLNIGREMIGDFKDLRDSATDITAMAHNLPGQLDIDDFDISKPDDFREVLDVIYDPNANSAEAGSNVEVKEGMEQRALKGAIESSQKITSDFSDDLNNISSLIDEIDQTETQKEAQDLTNRLLVELVTIQRRSLQLMAQAVRAEKLAQYEGASSNSPDARGEPKTQDNRHPFHRSQSEGTLSGPKNVRERFGKENMECAAQHLSGNLDACEINHD